MFTISRCLQSADVYTRQMFTIHRVHVSHTSQEVCYNQHLVFDTTQKEWCAHETHTPTHKQCTYTCVTRTYARMFTHTRARARLQSVHMFTISRCQYAHTSVDVHTRARTHYNTVHVTHTCWHTVVLHIPHTHHTHTYTHTHTHHRVWPFSGIDLTI